MARSSIIIAPHPDDELIGAFELLLNKSYKNVLVVFVTGKPTDEAVEFYNDHSIKHTCLDYTEQEFYCKEIVDSLSKNFLSIRDKHYLELTNGEINFIDIAVPEICDKHMVHKIVNIAAKVAFDWDDNLIYYSVDMSLAKPISYWDIKEKILEKLYVDQMKSLKSDKYFLFESVKREDFRRYIHCGFKLKGYHKYPKCSGKYASKIRKTHKHNFTIKVKIQTYHDDREIEFLEFRDEMRDFTKKIDVFLFKDSTKSCEHMARNILTYLFINYPGREVSVSVYEDDLNGAEITWGSVPLPELCDDKCR